MWDVEIKAREISIRKKFDRFTVKVTIRPANGMIDGNYTSIQDEIKGRIDGTGGLPDDFFSIDIDDHGAEIPLLYGYSIDVSLRHDIVDPVFSWVELYCNTHADSSKKLKFNAFNHEIIVELSFERVYYDASSKITVEKKKEPFDRDWERDYISFYFKLDGRIVSSKINRDDPPIMVIKALNDNFFFNENDKEITFKYNINTIAKETSKVPCRFHYAPGFFEFTFGERGTDEELWEKFDVSYPRRSARLEKVKYSYGKSAPFKLIRNVTGIWGIVMLVDILFSHFGLDIDVTNYIKYAIMGILGVAGIVDLAITYYRVSKKSRVID